MVVFEDRENRSTRRKPLGAENRTNKLNHMTPDLGTEPGPHWWEAIALTTATSLHPLTQFNETLGLSINYFLALEPLKFIIFHTLTHKIRT